jgi:hypothetical protein
MIAGFRERFAIEAEVEDRITSWVLGHIRFWICGRPVGNWVDSVDMLGCLRWLREFSDTQRDRYEPGLWNLPANEVFRLLFDSVMAVGDIRTGMQIRDAYSRFHISHLGMSSFERFDILLLHDEHGAERCLWRESGIDEIHDCRLWRREMELVAGEFCDRLEESVRGG